MKFLKYSVITLLSIVLIGSAGYLLASSGIQSKPGYAKLTMPSWFTTDTIVAINLGPRGLKPVRWMIERAVSSSNDNLELDEKILLSLLQDLQGVQLRIYEVENNRKIFERAIDESLVTLKQDGWQTLITVREDEKRIIVMQSTDAELITGFSILVSTPENAVFVNLIGQLNPESIALLAESLN